MSELEKPVEEYSEAEYEAYRRGCSDVYSLVLDNTDAISKAAITISDIFSDVDFIMPKKDNDDLENKTETIMLTISYLNRMLEDRYFELMDSLKQKRGDY